MDAVNIVTASEAESDDEMSNNADEGIDNSVVTQMQVTDANWLVRLPPSRHVKAFNAGGGYSRGSTQPCEGPMEHPHSAERVYTLAIYTGAYWVLRHGRISLPMEKTFMNMGTDNEDTRYNIDFIDEPVTGEEFDPSDLVTSKCSSSGQHAELMWAFDHPNQAWKCTFDINDCKQDAPTLTEANYEVTSGSLLCLSIITHHSMRRDIHFYYQPLGLKWDVHHMGNYVYLVITEVMENSWAKISGIVKGHIIYKINGWDVPWWDVDIPKAIPQLPERQPMANEIFHSFQQEWRTNENMIVYDCDRYFGKTEAYLTFTETLRSLPRYKQVGDVDSMHMIVEKNKLSQPIHFNTPLSPDDWDLVTRIALGTPCPNPRPNRDMKYVWKNVERMKYIPLVVRTADQIRHAGRILHEAYKLALDSVDEFRDSMDLLSTLVKATNNTKTKTGLYMEMLVEWEHDRPAEGAYISSIGDTMEMKSSDREPLAMR